MQKKTLAEIDLLKLVNNLECSISSYDGIMKWAKKWNSNGLSFSVDMSKSTFKTRSAVLNRLSQRYDLDQRKPFQKEVQLVINNTDNEELLSLMFLVLILGSRFCPYYEIQI